MARALCTMLMATATFALASCASAEAPQQITWQPVEHAPGIVDLAGPTADGRLVAAVSDGLSLFSGAALSPFTSRSGRGAYAPSGGEPYIVMTPEVRLRNAGCAFHRNEVFAIGGQSNRITRISPRGRASNLTTVPSPFLSGIAFDRVGRFGHRLLVTGTANGQTTLYGVDCRGRSKVIASGAPLVEGGMAVAPRSFGRFGGRLIAADELSGRIYAFKPSGGTTTLAAPGLPTGQDLGVESLGFVPRLRPGGGAFLADRAVPGNPHPGSDAILRLRASQLDAAQVRPGDLLVATEGGAETVVVRCPRLGACAVREIGSGPSITHAEGHIAFRGLRR